MILIMLGVIYQSCTTSLPLFAFGHHIFSQGRWIEWWALPTLLLPGQGVSTEVCDLQGPAKLNALRDLRNVCRRKEEVGCGGGGDRSQIHGDTDVDLRAAVIFYRAHHFKFLVITTRWSREVRERNGKTRQKEMFHQRGHGQRLLLHLHFPFIK